MPDWLVQLLIQYPIVVIVGFVAWYVNGIIERVMGARIKREQELHTTAITELKDAHKQATNEVQAEVGELKAELRDEFKKLGKKVDELTWRLSP
ncbi:hypothetical protein [Frigoriglobus tundricola]|uniref:Uncharacterized protein n=1 Tax=Frigoriglobus tundricola TaxID=2774151 RepID=A0A6M5YT95_9BACT|nr:hypothetical protein [Frigoriglobus tundricola]QJW96543.1 hypothetical protein FTUN_4100 [Frigoriglobus tundricola]